MAATRICARCERTRTHESERKYVWPPVASSLFPAHNNRLRVIPPATLSLQRNVARTLYRKNNHKIARGTILEKMLSRLLRYLVKNVKRKSLNRLFWKLLCYYTEYRYKIDVMSILAKFNETFYLLNDNYDWNRCTNRL